jgi:putative transposase
MLAREATVFFVSTFTCRRLPHYHVVGKAMFLTWRLFGSLPVGRAFASAATHGKAFLALDRLLDNARTGPLFLRMPEIAGVVDDAIRYREGRHYELHSHVIMANHVHLLITPLVPVSKMMQSLKRFTAYECNRALGRTGQAFWQDESYDRLVRSDLEFDRINHYIAMNPVKAGLVGAPEEFRWSSSWPIGKRPQVEQPAHKEKGLGRWSLGLRSDRLAGMLAHVH